MEGREWKELYKSESMGGMTGYFGVRILVAANKLPNLNLGSIVNAATDAASTIASEIQAAIIAEDESAKEVAKLEKDVLIALFKGRIFVEEIPNGYCSNFCCKHLPWFVITTEIGRFKVGRRKRVFHLEWTETVGTKTAEELFPDEDVTKSGKTIHVWSLVKMHEYLAVIFPSLKK